MRKYLFIFICLLMLGLSSSQEWQLIERWSFDQLTILNSANSHLKTREETDIIIIGIDEPSFSQLRYQWPWPRATHAGLIERLTQAGAAVIAFDILFSDPSRYGIEDDQALVKAINKSAPVILARYSVWQDTHQGLLNTQVQPLEKFIKAGAVSGLVQIQPDADGILRELPEYKDSFWQAILWQAKVKQPTIDNKKNILKQNNADLKADIHESAMVNYFGSSYTFPYVHYYQALDPELLPDETFKDRIVLIGLNLKASAQLKGAAIDRYMTPFFRNDKQSMPAVEYFANVLENVRHQLYITPVSSLTLSIILILLGLGSALILQISSFRKGSFLILALSLALIVFSWWLFVWWKVWLPILAALIILYGNYLVNGAILFYRERQKRRQLDLEKRQLQAEQLQTAIETAEKLKALDKLKDEFLAKTSHELRTPLQGILGLSENYFRTHLTQLKTDEEKQFKTIINTAKRLSTLIDDILDFSQIQKYPFRLNIQAVDIKSIIQVSLDISRPLAEQKQLELIAELPDQIPPLAVDENRLQQVLLNLIGNAIKFTQSGSVRVKAEQTNQDNITVSVHDTGVGISDSDLPNIFQAFQQGKSASLAQVPGSGIGLALTKQLIELMGGSIAVKSNINQGSEFFVNLPIATNQSLAKKIETVNIASLDQSLEVIEDSNDKVDTISSELVPQSSNKAWHILIVDDDPVNLEVLQGYLAEQIYQVSCVSSADLALNHLNQHPCDLILLDVMMPGKSGLELCREIRAEQRWSTIRIIFLSAKGQISDIENGFAMGSDDYLVKPIKRNELLVRMHYQLSTLNSQLLFDSVFKMANQVGQFKDHRQALNSICGEIEQLLPLSGYIIFNEEQIYQQQLFSASVKQLQTFFSLSLMDIIHQNDLLTEQQQELAQWFNHTFPEQALGHLSLLALSHHNNDLLLLFRLPHLGEFNRFEQNYLKSMAAQLRSNKQNIKQIIQDKKQNEQLIGIEELQANIIYIKGSSPYSTLVFDAREKNCKDIRISISLLSDYFDHTEMIQVHRSYLVNPVYVIKLVKKGRDYQLIVKDKQRIKTALPVSRSNISRLKQHYSSWFN